MKLLQNVKTLLSNPEVAWDYLSYCGSKLKNSGQAVRLFPNDIKVTNLSGFSEFHSCSKFLSCSEREFIQNFPIGEGDLIDIGANLGIVSMILSKRFPRRHVHAFEPNPSTFQALQNNVASNLLTNLHTKQCAVAEHNGEVSFRADPIHRGTTSIATSVDQYTISVPCITLDTYVESQAIKSIALLKVDVEGYETLVFQGAKHLLSQQMAQVIYYEVCPALTRKAEFAPELPTQLLQQNGYQIYKLDEKGSLMPAHISNISQVVVENWIAVRP
jgi:FkbM family methyltransferase